MFVCLQNLGTKGTLHHLPILQNNEPVPQVVKTVCKPVLLLFKPVYNSVLSVDIVLLKDKKLLH